MDHPATSLAARLQPWVLAGLFGFVPHLVAVVLASLQRPGFDHRAQYLSELGERGSATAALTNHFGILPTGALLAWFGLGVLRHWRAHRALATAGALILTHGLLRVVAALFPCDAGCRPLVPTASQIIHNAAAAGAFVSLSAALFVAGAWLIRRRRGAPIIAATYVLGIVALAAQGMLVAAPAGAAGLYQRLALAALQLWVVLLAWHLGARPATDTQPETSREAHGI